MQDNQGTNKKIISNVAWSYAERFSTQMVSTLVSIVLARLLETEHYGVIAIVMVFISIMEVLITGGYGNALIQKKDAQEVDFHTIFWVNMAIGVAEYTILFLGAPLVAQFYDMPILQPVLRVLGLRVFLSAIYSVQSAYVQKKLQFRMFFFSTLGGTIVSAVVVIAMALLGAGVWALVAQYLVSSFINVCVLWFLIDWSPKLRFSAARLKQMMNFGTAMFMATVINAFQDNIRSLVVGKKFNAETLAFYNQGKKYPQLLMTDIIGSIGKVMFPVLSSQNAKDESKRLMRNAVRISTYILTPMVLGLIAIADNFVLVLFTEKWMGCVVYMRILALVFISRPISTILQNGLLSAGESKSNLVHEFACAVLSLILIFVSVFVFESAIFVALSYVIVMLVGLTIRMYYSSKYLDYSPAEIARDYLPYLLLAAVACGGAFLFGFINMHPFVLLVCQVLVGGVLYVVLSALLKVPEFKMCLKLIKGFLPKGKKV